MRSWPLLSLLLLVGCPTRAAEHPPAFAQKIAGVKGVDNFAKIHDGLYRGAQPSNEGLDSLKIRGIRTVINLRSHHSQTSEARARGLAVVEIPLQADLAGSTPPTDEQIKLFFETVLDPSKQPVYVHCAHGKDRTGAMAALYRIEIDGWTPDQAIEEMQAFGFHDVFQDLIDFVKAYKPRGYKSRR